MWELDDKEGWAPMNWCFQIVVLEKTLESLLNCQEIKPVNPKGNQPWIFIGRTDAEDEIPILWPPDAKSQLIGKDPSVFCYQSWLPWMLTVHVMCMLFSTYHKAPWKGLKVHRNRKQISCCHWLVEAGMERVLTDSEFPFGVMKLFWN